MSASGKVESARKMAIDLLAGPRWRSGGGQEVLARKLLPQLRDLREFDLLTQLSERVARSHPHDPLIRRLQTQGLIETGHTTAAIEVARSGLKGLADSHGEWSELNGLIGRAYKQIVMDAAEPRDPDSRAALRESLKAYAKPYRKDTNNTWHAINLAAVSSFAKRVGIKSPANLGARELAGAVIQTIETKPENIRDHWDAATLAEAYLALSDLAEVERHLKTYLADARVSAFDVGSTLRQFSQVWGLKDAKDARERGILQALGARLLQLPGADIGLSPQSGVQSKQLASHCAPPRGWNVVADQRQARNPSGQRRDCS